MAFKSFAHRQGTSDLPVELTLQRLAAALKRQSPVPPEHAEDSIGAAKQATRPDFFTVGATKDEVLQLQGQPSWFTDDEWTFGSYSKVYFRNDRVVRWSSGDAELRARLVPSGPAVTTNGYFTVGATKDEVLQLQGQPSWFTDDEWTFGSYSKVYFRNDRVLRWSSGDVELRARLVSGE